MTKLFLKYILVILILNSVSNASLYECRENSKSSLMTYESGKTYSKDLVYKDGATFQCVTFVKCYFFKNYQIATSNGLGRLGFQAYKAYKLWDLGYGSGIEPRNNSILVMGSKQLYGVGHVAVVKTIKENGSYIDLLVDEANWDNKGTVYSDVIYKFDPKTLSVQRNNQGTWYKIEGFVYGSKKEVLEIITINNKFEGQINYLTKNDKMTNTKGSLTVSDGKQKWSGVILDWKSGEANFQLYTNGLNGTTFPLLIKVFNNPTLTSQNADTKIAEFYYPFVDISDKFDGAKDIIDMWKAGFVTGKAGNKFEPKSPIKASEFVKLMFNYLPLENPKLSMDDAWNYCKFIGACNNISKDTELTRGQTADILAIYLEKKYSGFLPDLSVNPLLVNTTNQNSTNFSIKPNICPSNIWSENGCKLKYVQIMRGDKKGDMNKNSLILRIEAIKLLNRTKNVIKSFKENKIGN